MHLMMNLIFPFLWISWSIYWWYAARGAKQTARVESIGSRALHIFPFLICIWLLWANQVPIEFLNLKIIPWSYTEFWISVLITIIGLGFSVWARVHLAGNWSGIVTVKENHELITSGPYALVRHPIYTGLLVAIIGSALARGEVRSLLCILIAFVAIWRKFKLEEKWMFEIFQEKYLEYSKRVPALIPFLK